MKKANSLFNEKQRYSIRKYHIGAASIIIGSVIFMNTGSISYAAEVDNNTSELIENKIHSNKEKLDNNNAVVQEKESNVVNDLDYNQSSNSKDTKEINKEVPLSSETSTIAPGYEENNLKSTISVNKDNGRNQQLNNQMTEEESQNQIEHNSKKNQTTQSNKDNNHINELVVKENTNQQGTEVINKEDTKQDNLKVDSISDENKMITNQNENRQKVRRKRNAVNPTNNPNIANDTYNRTANNVNTDVSTDGTMTYKWYPVIGGLSKQERTWMTNGVYGDNESRARKKATMLWLIANFNFTEEQRQNFSIQDLDSPIFGDDVYKWLEEAKKGNITPKPGTMNLGRRREMIISGNNIILSDHKAFDRGIINFGDNKNFVFSNDDSTSMVTNSNIDYGFKIKPPFEKVGVNNTWAISENEKEEIRRAIKKANSDINFVRINVAYNGNVFAQALNSSGKIVGSADLDGNEVVIDKIFIEKKEKLDQLISLVETSKLLDENLYIPSSFNHLKNELNYASIVIKDSYDPEMNNIPDIISATDRLDHGINSLVRRANMTELQNAINNAKAQGPFDNSKEEDQAIISALEVGENTVGNANTPQDVVDSATANINNALSRKSQVKNLLQDVENLVSEAEEKNRNASNMLLTALLDGIFINDEKNALIELVNSANDKKAEAQDKVNLLPDDKKTPFQNRLDKLPIISIPEVNDTDGNGIADDVDQAKAQAESKVAEAEAADQAAKTKLAEYQQDGLITSTEKTDLENLQSTAQNTKAGAQDLVNKLPDALKGDLPARVDNLTGVQVPAVNDADGNGIADEVDQAKSQAENKVAEAEAADQAAKTKLAEYQQDGVITPTEVAELNKLSTTAQNTKAEAQDLVNKLPDALKGDLPERLDNLTGIQIPEVNDADGNGIADDVDQAKSQAESKVAEAEAADQAAKTKLTEYQQDGIITASEKTDLENLSTTAQNKKVEAQDLVNKLPDAVKGDLPTRLNNLTGIQVPAVNDTDGNGIADEVDQAKSQAESKVAEAEAADQAAKTKLAEYQQDDLITPTEVAELENLQATAQSKKAEAQGLVDALPDVWKGDLPTRLNKLTGIQVPAVNDADGNGIADEVDQAKSQAENKVAEAEAADQAAKTKLTEYQQDGLITPTEVTELNKLSTTAQNKKVEAQDLVNKLPDALKGDLPARVDNLTGVQVPAVNDADGNGIADEVDQAKTQAENKVAEAEAADQAAKTKLTEYQQDGVITASEKTDLENLSTTAQNKKVEAQDLVNKLPDALKGDLLTRLNNLTGIQVPAVNDTDGNGIADEVDQAKSQAESKVAEAEAADQAAKTKLAEYQQDDLITPTEVAELENLQATAQSKKAEAQGLVDALPDALKDDLPERLDNLTGIQIPEVNDYDGNGFKDDIDDRKDLAESKVIDAEQANAIVKDKLAEYQEDSLITSTELVELENLRATAQSKKAKAQELVDTLPDVLKADLPERLSQLKDIQLPNINDYNGNGINDETDRLILNAEKSVINAEETDKAVKAKLGEYQKDGLISTNEKRELINLLTKAQRSKTEAQGLVDALPNEFKGNLLLRLNNLTGIEIPKVNDADNDGKKDDINQLKALIEIKVQEAEVAHQNATSKLTEYTRDGLINQWEKNYMINLTHEVFSRKVRAFALVEGLPKEQQGEFLNRLNKLENISIPEINDKNNNGIADDLDQAIALAEIKVQEAEAAHQIAKNKLLEYQQDDLISPTEKAELDKLVTEAQNIKAKAQELVVKLPDAMKGDLQNRLNNLLDIQVPEINDFNDNGIMDNSEPEKVQAESRVAQAEYLDQAVKDKLSEYQQNGLITPTEKAELDNLAKIAQNTKAEAQDFVDALPDVWKGDLPTRLNKLTGIQVPAVNDADGNGIADEVDQAKSQAESKVAEAEATDQAAKTKLTEYQQDGLITSTEKTDLENLQSTAQSKKAEAQDLVNKLPDAVKGDLPARLNNLTGIQVPEVNDADGNGIADEVDQAKSQAESKVAEAEAADQAAKTKLAEYQQDGVITPTEVAELNKLSTTAQNTKAEAQDLVNKLPDALKGDLPERLDNLTGIQIPEVNDADGNGIADDVDQAKSQAESKVAEAEAADQAAKTKLTEYQQDGIITASEKTDLENLSTTAQNKKVEAQDLVNKLPDAVKGDLPTRLNNLTGIQVPAVNDTDGNGIADEVDQAKAQAESKVTEAEVAYQVAKTKLSEYQQDGVITAVEKANLENLISTAKSKKVEAQKLVNALPDNVKEVLQSRLNKLEDIVIPSISMNNQNSQLSSSHNTQGKDDETKVKDILQKLSDLNNDSQKSLNSKDDTSNESKHTHITTANSHTINTNSVSVNSNNTKRVKDNNAKVLSPSKVYDTKKTKEVDSKVLPNTGEETTQNTTLFGTLLASLGSLMIWRSRKKENTNETK
ncbi:GA-like domain-containing protein [Staphylococcus shinii]|uniref:GA-like domain-containing protein n=11 Tax=Staphylococcus shinii TaxID=2912228 RepID=UPI00192D9AA6|nr:YSIRK-type signal peptide-containing protein [Staphylococcus shinii]QRA16874.1 YSIRK-type signal peptide-containing protein [Staphylococcus shinii]